MNNDRPMVRRSPQGCTTQNCTTSPLQATEQLTRRRTKAPIGRSLWPLCHASADVFSLDRFSLLTSATTRRISRALANNQVREPIRACHARSMWKIDAATEWLSAKRRRMPGLWERSCVKRDRQSAECGPSRAKRSGGFFVARSRLIEQLPGVTPERETRIPGLARENARAQARGACRRERGDEPDTDGRANSSEFAISCASAPHNNYSVIRFAAYLRLNQRWW
jgi:hypothetical protein